MTGRATWLLPLAALGAIGAAVFISLSQGDEPESLSDLRRAQEAGERAGAAGRRIVANLERIESNLEQGAGLSEETGTIRDLTSRQSRSLENLVDLLTDQLETLRRTEATLRDTQRSAADVGRLGATQLDVLRRTLAALRKLEGDVRFSTRMSGELSRLAIYGARLAEDSQKRFSEP